MKPAKKRIIGFATHEEPSIDEAFSMWMLLRFGHLIDFEVDEDFELHLLSTIDLFRQMLSAQQMLDEKGIICLGIGGGEFDEHPVKGQARKANECCATLVAKKLGITQHPGIKYLLGLTKADDLGVDLTEEEGERERLFARGSLPKLIKAKYEIGKDVADVINWAIEQFDDLYQQQRRFHIDLQQICDRSEYLNVSAIGNQQIKLAVIQSDERGVQLYALAVHKNDLALVLNSTGHFKIFANRKSFLAKSFVPEFAMAVRKREAEKRGIQITKDPNELVSEGLIEGIDNIYYSKGPEMILNGSNTNRDVEPSLLKPHELKTIIKFVLSAPNEVRIKAGFPVRTYADAA